jgi:capsular polysaccharide export protein
MEIYNPKISSVPIPTYLNEHATIYVWRMPFWKRPIIKRFLAGQKLCFTQQIRRVKSGSSLLLWGSRPVPAGINSDVSILRVEDGFLRSVGLGVELTRPVSWIIDTQGIYYNATSTSDLEQILQDAIFPEQLLKRANLFHQRLVTCGVTKYNLSGQDWKPPSQGKRIILVPGQVEADASIAFGAGAVKTNIGLIRAVRANNPDAWLIYKPHPDVVAGLRARGIDDHKIKQYCDEYLESVSIEHVLQHVDEVHVMTSLAGFEALLRGKSVTCYGLPFYAGWGLTTDMMSTSRRTRKLSLQELIAGALLLYPSYISWEKGTKITPEEALDELILKKELKVPGRIVLLKRFYRMALRLIVSVRQKGSKVQ